MREPSATCWTIAVTSHNGHANPGWESVIYFRGYLFVFGKFSTWKTVVFGIIECVVVVTQLYTQGLPFVGASWTSWRWCPLKSWTDAATYPTGWGYLGRYALMRWLELVRLGFLSNGRRENEGSNHTSRMEWHPVLAFKAWQAEVLSSQTWKNWEGGSRGGSRPTGPK